MPLDAIISGQFQKPCDKAENGKIALDMYLANAQKICCDVRYRVVLTDIQMPVMDGIESAKLILENQAKFVQQGFNLPPIKIAAVSAYNDEETKQKCIGVGVHDYLTKPVNVHTLRAIFETVYKNEKFDV